MTPSRTPAVTLIVTASLFAIWAVVLILSPGGSKLLEWIQLVVAAGLIVFGVLAYRTPTTQMARRIRYTLTAFAVFGAIVVIGLAADDNSSRTWARIGWAALLTGSIGSIIAWWNAPTVKRVSLLSGGAIAAIVIIGGLGITLNCDDSLQRSWCEPLFEEEQALVEIIVVEGDIQRTGRAGGDGGAALIAYVVTGNSIEDNTSPPEGFVYEERPIQSIEIARGRYRAESGPNAHCKIDVKIEQIPAGTIQTVMVSCL